MHAPGSSRREFAPGLTACMHVIVHCEVRIQLPACTTQSRSFQVPQCTGGGV
jgi:hypothetical protein